MKIFLLLSIIFIIGVNAEYSEGLKKLQEEARRIEEYRKPCLEEVGLFTDSSSANSPTIGQIFCLWACLYRKNGSINPDGTANEASIRLRNPEFAGSLKTVISNCEMQADGNSCKLAGCLAKAHFNLLE